MENIERLDDAVPATVFGLSWVAYVRPVAVFLVMQLLAGIFSGFVHLLLAILALAWLVYWVMDARELRLYTDEEGVWLRSGVLPWTRGVSGVKWRDVDDATYYSGFFSWVAKSYQIRIGHRFTKSSEIVLHHIRDGNLAVEMINAMHRDMIAGVRESN